MMTIRDDIASQIKQEVLGSGSRLFREPLVGFAAAADPLFPQLKQIVGPEHLLPADILPGARTVVAFFLPFSREVVAGNRKSGAVGRIWAEAYLEANRLINGISDRLIQSLAAGEIRGATVKATHNFDQTTLKSSWSHRSAAFIAGLGRFGLNRMLITPAGCAGRYGSVVISEAITPDRRTETELCRELRGGKCGYCIKACPTGALTADGWDKFKCYRHLLEVDQGFADLGLCDVCGKCAVGPCAILAGEPVS
jgi:epoxyqueuosine reductase